MLSDLDNTKFAIVNSTASILTTPLFSLIGQTSASIGFYQAYNLVNAGAQAKIEISTDGGTTYTTLKTYAGVSFKNIVGTTGTLGSDVIDLSNYLGLSNLMLRFNLTGTVSGSTWAIDNVATPGTSLPISYMWSGNILNVTTGVPVIATPQVTGNNAYTLQTTVAGCPGGSVIVNVLVKGLQTHLQIGRAHV